jgi:hypothetical protein
MVDQTSGGNVAAQRVTPARQQGIGVAEFQRSDAGMVATAEGQSGPVSPALPVAVVSRQDQQAFAADHQDAAGEAQAGVEIDLEPGDDCFVARHLAGQLRRPGGRRGRWRQPGKRRAVGCRCENGLGHGLAAFRTRLPQATVTGEYTRLDAAAEGHASGSDDPSHQTLSQSLGR